MILSPAVLPQEFAQLSEPQWVVSSFLLKRLLHGGGAPSSGEHSSARQLWWWCSGLLLNYAILGNVDFSGQEDLLCLM